MFQRIFMKIVLLITVIVMLAGCAAPVPEVTPTAEIREVQVVVTATPQIEVEKHAKYIFVFIGDGMGVAQRNAAELYLAATAGKGSRPEDAKLLMNTFPAQGMNTTYDLTSIIPDSASTATAISTGYKTKSGVIGMDSDGKVSYQNISELAKSKDWKVGIISTVSIDHATPAAFYAHVPTRKNMYDINVQLANSGFDYFAGGQMFEPSADGKPDAMKTAVENGYTLVTDRDDFEKLKAGDEKVLAFNGMVQDSGAMYYTIDQPKGYITLSEYVSKGIELLDNPAGFFMMVEGGKIDWACHANDASASIHDTLAFDEAVAEAYKFYEDHPEETLIIVTGDHETGGMTIGYAGTQYASFVDKISNQTMSYVEFRKKLEEYKAATTVKQAKLEDILPIIEEAFGLYVMPKDKRAELDKIILDGAAKGASDEAKKAAVAAKAEINLTMAINDIELAVIEDAFKQSMLDNKERTADEYTYLLYGGYDPLSVKLTTILNNKAGIAWTSYSHTGVPVQTSAVGVQAELFNGYYDQTDIYFKLVEIAGL